jgi:chromatin structure-remodeling complex protein RSC7
MKSSGKIIIKPRTSKRSTARRDAPSDSKSPATPTHDETDDDQMDEDDRDENPNESVDTPTQPLDSDEADDADEQGEEDAEDETAEGEEEIAPVPAKRPRGRPKGSGIKSTAGTTTATSTPRSRPPRGRGRPRGRPPRTPGAGGAGLTIRLKAPKGEDGESGDEEEYSPEAEAPTSGAAPTPPPVASETRETPAKEGPMGGGKPFRKIGDKVYVIDGDEFVTEDNPKGDEKVDKWGNLLGGTSIS